MTSEQVFKVVSTVGMLCCVVILYFSYKVYRRTWDEKPEGFTGLPQIKESLLIPVVTAVLCSIYRKITKPLIEPFFMPIVKDIDDQKMRVRRADRAASETVRFSFHLLWTICSYIVLSGTDFLPEYLGGRGHVRNTLKNMPYFEQSWGVYEYTLIQIGYFSSDFFDTILFATGEDNYWQMFFHHLVTIVGLIAMSFQNHYRIGLIDLFIHSASDVLLHAAKIFSNTVYTKLAGNCFISGLIVWIYLRNICLPLVAYQAATERVYYPETAFYYYPDTVLIVFMMILSVIHLFWTQMLLAMLWKYYTKGATEDAHHRLKRD